MADDTREIDPQTPIEPAGIEVDEELAKRIVSTFRAAYDQALADRDALDEGILVAERNWEMVTVERTYPWRGASNVFIPIIPEQVMAVVSGTKAEVFTPGGPFLVVGKDELPQMRAHDVQRHYNGWWSQKPFIDRMTPAQEAEEFVGLAALHGTSYLDVTYLYKTSTRRYATFEAETDPETGEEVLDDDGDRKLKSQTHEVEFTEQGVVWDPLELRDIILIPARSKSMHGAYAKVRVMYMTEDEMRQYARKRKDGKPPLFDMEMVDYVCKGSVAKGGSERTQDPRGLETYTVGGQVEADTQPFMDDVMGKLLVTEYEVLRIETSAIDVNNDGVGEHMIFFIHRQPEAMLGSIQFPYNHNHSLTIDLSLLRRWKRAYGFGIPERLRTIQTEYNASFNQENDQSNLRTSPPRRQEEGVKVLGTDDGQWGPNVTFIGPKDSVGLVDLPDVLQSGREIRGELASIAQRISNQTPPSATGARVTKAGVAAAQAKQSAYQNTMSENVRYALAEALWLTKELDIQFGPQTMETTTVGPDSKPKKVQITKADLQLDMLWLINGMGGPQDPQADRNDRLLVHNMLMGRSDFANDPKRLYKLDKFGFQSFNLADLEEVLGTPEEADQRAQAQQQAQQQQQQMEQARLAAGGGGKPGGAPPTKPGGGMQPPALGR